MDHLWSPWRYRYVTAKPDHQECVFCRMLADVHDEDHLILHRSDSCFIVLNRYPYTSGHLMVVPNQHVSSLEECPDDALQSMILLAKKLESQLREVYRCPGLNMGFNIGECAGAGIAQHLHFHILPRWPGDANFMTAVGETRVLPEDLATTYSRLKPFWS